VNSQKGFLWMDSKGYVVAETAILKRELDTDDIQKVRINFENNVYTVSLYVGQREFMIGYSVKNKKRATSGQKRVFKSVIGAIRAIKEIGYSGDVIVEV